MFMRLFLWRDVMNIGILGSGKIVVDLLCFIKNIEGIHIEAIIGREHSKDKINQWQKTTG